METSGNIRLQIIQGDSFDREVYVEGVELEKIEGIYFSCEDLGICRKLTYYDEEGYFGLSLSPEETILFPKINTNYDLTVKFVDEKIATATYCSQLTVLPKINKVACFGKD